MPKKTMPKKTTKSKPLTPKTARKRVAPRLAKTSVEKALAGKTKKGLAFSTVGVTGKTKGTITLPDELFDAKVNVKLISQSVRVYLANQRAGTASTKTRGEVEGSTRKIYRQKGTGRARHGAIRAPIFVGGGIVFGPKPRDYSLAFPKKMKRAALASALTASLHEKKLTVVDGLETLEPKTKLVAKTLASIAAKRPTLLVVGPGAETLARAARNIEGVEIISAHSINPYAILSHASLVFTKQAIPVLSQTFLKHSKDKS